MVNKLGHANLCVLIACVLLGCLGELSFYCMTD